MDQGQGGSDFHRVRRELRRVRHAPICGRGRTQRWSFSTRADGAGHNGEGMSQKVLLVDDSGLARRSTRRILEGAGYEVVEAEDGMAAIEQYFVEKPDVVMLDLVMKGMYGLEVLERLRELDPAARVIVVSADVQTSSHELVAQGGAAGFLVKPVDANEVLALVRSTLGESI